MGDVWCPRCESSRVKIDEHGLPWACGDCRWNRDDVAMAEDVIDSMLALVVGQEALNGDCGPAEVNGVTSDGT